MTDSKRMADSLVFFGSGPVAARSLELLVQDFTVEAVVTKPKPAHHRGDVPVLALTERLGLKTYTPANKAELSEMFAFSPVQSRVGVVIDYGIIINQDVIDYFPFGIANSHFSLLPEWRGADPISFAILSGQRQTGVSLMLIVQQMDAGPLLAQAPYDLPPDITTPQLTEGLIDLSHQMLKVVLPEYLTGKVQPVPQDPNQEPTYSRKLTKDDGLIDWRKPAEQIEREIRAYIDWPKSRTSLAGIDAVITKARTAGSREPRAISPGTVSITADKELAIQTAEGLLIIERLKPAGKAEMTAQAFLAGYGNRL